MATFARLGGILGILVSLVPQLFGFRNDVYHLGNIWFLGVFAGIIGLIGVSFINKNIKLSLIFISISFVLGFISNSSLGIISGVPQLICIVYLLLGFSNSKFSERTNDILFTIKKNSTLTTILALLSFVSFLLAFIIGIALIRKNIPYEELLLYIVVTLPYIGFLSANVLANNFLKISLFSLNILSVLFCALPSLLFIIG